MLNYFSQSFYRRLMADKPCRLDALILWARCGHRKLRLSQLKRVVLDQQAEDKKRKAKV